MGHQDFGVLLHLPLELTHLVPKKRRQRSLLAMGWPPRPECGAQSDVLMRASHHPVSLPAVWTVETVIEGVQVVTRSRLL